MRSNKKRELSQNLDNILTLDQKLDQLKSLKNPTSKTCSSKNQYLQYLLPPR